MRDDTYVTLVALEHDWGHAWMTRNVALCEQIMADDFLEVSALGRVASRGEWVAAMLGHPPRQLQWADVRVRPAGRCAIVHGLLRLQATVPGHEVRQGLVATDVWLWRSGSWQVVSRQLTVSHAPLPHELGASMPVRDFHIPH